MTPFAKESDFEAAVIHELRQRGWGDAPVLKNPTEAELLANWAQILEQIKALRTPPKLNGFINGKTVAITRANPADALHFGKEVSLKIYDRHEIAAAPHFGLKAANIISA